MKTVIDLGSFDENYANYSNADEVILVDLDSEISQYGEKPLTLLNDYYDKMKANLSDDLKKRIEELMSPKKIEKKEIKRINSDAIDFFGKYEPKNVDKIHASYLFCNIDRGFGESKNVEAQKLLLLNSLTSLKEEGVLEIAEDVQKKVGETDSAQMRLIKELIKHVNKNQKLNYKFIIEKEEKISLPETIFEAIYILNEQPRSPGKIILKKVKKTEEEKNKQKSKFKIVKITNPAK